MAQQTLENLSFTPLTTTEIRPKGWLRRQLEIQAEGLSGNLDKYWPDIKDSKWIGGEAEGWERVPYWLDGFIPLAYLLDDEDMKRRAQKYIDAIIEGQQEDGWICPCSEEERPHYDMWAFHLILKVLVVYYECTKDERIEEVVYRALQNFDRHIDTHTVFQWGSMRWFELLIPLFWLYERRGEQWLLDLAVKLKAQGFDYQTLYENWPYENPLEFGHWSHMCHVVNQAMAVKSLALFSRISGDEEDRQFAQKMLDKLMKHHGLVTGIFTGDECLSGDSPIQGTELCAVTEFMYSLEHLIQITGEAKWSDRLEYIAYNALPATFSQDMWTHQYDQQVNQIECSVIEEGKQPFRTNSGEAHIFGLEPNYGCCTANMNQAWPKFALSTFMKTEDGFACTVLAPSEMKATFKEANVQIGLETDYPFHHQLNFTVKVDQPVEFAFDVRIPSFCTRATVNGEKVEMGKYHRIFRTWKGEETIVVELHFETEFVQRPEDMVAVRRGPLLYSIAIEEDWQQIDYGPEEKVRMFPHCDYEIFPKSPWNYAYVNDEATFMFNGIGDYPFSTEAPPIEAQAKVVEIDWPKKDGVILRAPKDRTPQSEVQTVRLIPYGCTQLRMTEVPLLQLSPER